MPIRSVFCIVFLRLRIEAPSIVSPSISGGSSVPLPAANISETEAYPASVIPTTGMSYLGGVPWYAGRL
jgi:hypothetical protein